MRNFLLASAMAIACAVPAIASAQTAQDTYQLQQAQSRFNGELSIYRQELQRSGNNYRQQTRFQRSRDRLDRALSDYRIELDRYQQIVRGGNYAANGNYNSRPVGDDTYYDPSRDYRDGDYRERVVGTDERVYRGTDGRYYCKRNDGTTGLIVGGLAGGVLGNVIDGGRSRVLGTLLGGALGAVGGRAIERSANDRNGQVTCR
jgi:opacity protein-like surface antigen